MDANEGQHLTGKVELWRQQNSPLMSHSYVQVTNQDGSLSAFDQNNPKKKPPPPKIHQTANFVCFVQSVFSKFKVCPHVQSVCLSCSKCVRGVLLAPSYQWPPAKKTPPPPPFFFYSIWSVHLLVILTHLTLTLTYISTQANMSIVTRLRNTIVMSAGGTFTQPPTWDKAGKRLRKGQRVLIELLGNNLTIIVFLSLQWTDFAKLLPRRCVA